MLNIIRFFHILTIDGGYNVHCTGKQSVTKLGAKNGKLQNITYVAPYKQIYKR
jgi:hypothetical protein